MAGGEKGGGSAGIFRKFLPSSFLGTFCPEGGGGAARAFSPSPLAPPPLRTKPGDSREEGQDMQSAFLHDILPYCARKLLFSPFVGDGRYPLLVSAKSTSPAFSILLPPPSNAIKNSTTASGEGRLRLQASPAASLEMSGLQSALRPPLSFARRQGHRSCPFVLLRLSCVCVCGNVSCAPAATENSLILSGPRDRDEKGRRRLRLLHGARPRRSFQGFPRFPLCLCKSLEGTYEILTSMNSFRHQYYKVARLSLS